MGECPSALSHHGNVAQEASSSLYYLLKPILHLQSVLGGEVALRLPHAHATRRIIATGCDKSQKMFCRFVSVQLFIAKAARKWICFTRAAVVPQELQYHVTKCNVLFETE